MTTTTTPTTSPSPPEEVAKSYCEKNLPPLILEKLEAGAFRSLCTHLRERSDSVQNIDLMNVSGFCRNCLAKWLVVEARQLEGVDDRMVQNALDVLGYDEAAEFIYGCEYGEWKKQHAKKATEEQMQTYNESKPLHATHDKQLLEKRAVPAAAADGEETSKLMPPPSAGATTTSSLASNVCCQDDEKQPTASSSSSSTAAPAAKKAKTITEIAKPDPPKGGISLKVAIMTVSDRAAAGQYETGDLSGPAVEESLQTTIESINNLDNNTDPVLCEIVQKAVVPDEMDEIQALLTKWSSSDETTTATTTPDVILTTGGTGFAARDVTPEATLKVLDRECRGLMAYVMTECSMQQPLASLSRGMAGICGNTMIVNLPGNPKGVGEVIPVLMPLLLHAVKDLQQTK